MFCHNELPVLGRVVKCSRKKRHDGECSGRVMIHRSRGETRPAAQRWYRVTWGPARPVMLNRTASIADEVPDSECCECMDRFWSGESPCDDAFCSVLCEDRWHARESNRAAEQVFVADVDGGRHE